MRTNKLLQSIFVLSLLLLMSIESHAQSITSATIRESVEYWQELTNPTLIGNGDDPWAQLTMPFTFSYDNQNITTLYVYNNGYISLNSAGNPSGYAIPGFPTANKIYWYGRDLINTGGLSFKVEGNAPFRVLAIQILDARYVTDMTGASFDCQIRFFESSNEIQIRYGDPQAIGGGLVNGFLGFVGSSAANYINIKPNAPEVASTIYRNNTQPWLATNVVKLFPVGRAFTYTTLPTISGIYPDNNAVIANGELYSGDNRPFVRISRSAGQKAVGVKYKITGPLGTPNSKVIYTAVDANDINSRDTVVPVPQIEGNQIRMFMPHAKNVAGVLEDGSLDLRDKVQTPSGNYEVEAVLTYLDGTPSTQTVKSQFKIAFQEDLAILGVSAPSDNAVSVYPLGGTVPFKARVKNFGSNPVTEFNLIANVYNNATGAFVTKISYPFNDELNPLKYNEFKDFDMPRWISTAIGQYKVVWTVSNPKIGGDDYPSDNVFPRTGAYSKTDYVFQVGYEIEAQTSSYAPTTSYINRPIRISTLFTNNGVSDLSDVPASITIKDPGGNVVYNETIKINEISSGIIKTKTIFWPKIFIPTQTGTYTGTINLNPEGDEKPENNTIPLSLTILGGMSGTYKISVNGGQFSTINQAVTALYERGVSGPVTFWLSDPVYNEGNVLFNDPAVDFSSKIIGASATNTIKFTIDPANNLYGFCTINLASASGIGVKIAQNSFPTNIKAAVLGVDAGNIKNYSNNDGYITFDGGTKKALVFTLQTTSPFRTVFYLGDGASNTTIKNVIIKDGINQSASLACRLPLSIFNSVLSKFTFDPNTTPQGTFTAGVLLRSVAPLNPTLAENTFFIDTLANSKNTVEGCEIAGFGYGIASLGIGVLFNTDAMSLQKYYNNNNNFTKNTIYNVSKAGVYLGFENNTIIANNRIYSVNGSCDGSAAAISLGGEARPGYFGYNNTNITITGNDISAIAGNSNVYGIKVEQNRNDIDFNNIKGSYPDVNENVKIINNLVWGLAPNATTTNVFGISLMTERNNGLDWTNLNFAPKFNNYFSRSDLIMNNSIFFSNDLLDNTGALANIALFNTKGAKLYNNALSLDETTINDANKVATNIFYYGLHANNGGIVSDRNVFWNKYTKGSLVRFIETDGNSVVLEKGYKNEFVNISQWQAWTGQDYNSVFGNFTNDYVITGDYPYTFRPMKNPVPTNSLLNNRGLSMAENQKDIDGVARGIAGERFDIGCAEFQGKVNNKDLEVLNFLAPLRYKATPGMAFDDAEYVMTYAPVNVKATIRNNGTLPLGNGSVTLKIYRQTVAGGWIQEGLDIKANVDELMYSNSAVVDFGLANGINTPPADPEFFPRTYGDLIKDNYVVPTQFKSMIANVTPLYKFEISVPNDELNSNNTITKIVRFYIRKSPIRLAISGENLGTYTSASNPEIIAANLNVDSLVAGFKALGWRNDLTLEDPKTDIDIFDRKVWEPRSVDYTIYRSLFWADGNDTRTGASGLENSTLSRYDRDHITAFLNSGSVVEKRNLIIGSQEMVRNEYPANAAWVKTVLNAKNPTLSNPLGNGVSYNGHGVFGLLLGRDLTFPVISTQFTNDNPPMAGLFEMDNAGVGNSRIGFKYVDHKNDIPGAPVADGKRIAAMPTSSIDWNIVHIGIDWRHWQNIEKVIRAIIDYVEFEGGLIVPVDMLSFEAVPVGKRVDVSWSTASETNSSYFNIEKSAVAGNYYNFNSIDRVPAIENSSVTTNYGPYVDNNVEYGKTYAYRLKMTDKAGNFDYTDVKLATLTSQNGVMLLSEVSPNPANSNSKIEFTVTESSNVKLSIYDLNGVEVAVIFNGTKPSGTYSFLINTNNLSNGAYTVTLSNGTDILSTRLNVVK